MGLSIEEQFFGGPNPFAVGDNRRELWVGLCRIGAEEEAANYAKCLQNGFRPSSFIDFFCGFFDSRAKVLVNLGVWGYGNVDDCRTALGRLSEVTTKRAREKCGDQFGRSFHSELTIRVLQRSAHWTHEAIKLARESEANRRDDESPEAAQGKDERRPAKWEEIEIGFTSDERVQVIVNAKTYTMNYAEMGFEDRKSKTPNKAWVALRVLAEQKGVLTTSSPNDWPKLERRIYEIRKTLKRHFDEKGFDIPADSNPIPFTKGRDNGYRSSFRLRVHPSFNT